MRRSRIRRKTRETDILLSVDLAGTGQSRINTPIGFLTHMLETLSRHSGFDLEARVKGDLHVDQHHLVEDTALVLGQALAQALADKRGIGRMGFFICPMDDALALVSLDLSGRPFLRFEAGFRARRVGDMNVDLVEDFFHGLSSALSANIHVKVLTGRSDHHKVEAIFKALAKSLGQACAVARGSRRRIPSTKGIL